MDPSDPSNTLCTTPRCSLYRPSPPLVSRWVLTMDLSDPSHTLCTTPRCPPYPPLPALGYPGYPDRLVGLRRLSPSAERSLQVPVLAGAVHLSHHLSRHLSRHLGVPAAAARLARPLEAVRVGVRGHVRRAATGVTKSDRKWPPTQAGIPVTVEARHDDVRVSYELRAGEEGVRRGSGGGQEEAPPCGTGGTRGADGPALSLSREDMWQLYKPSTSLRTSVARDAATMGVYAAAVKELLQLQRCAIMTRIHT
eukprot:1162829-Prorocentrum_minimum.AAC.7